MLHSWDQGAGVPRKVDLPPVDQQLLTPTLANAFGITMDGGRYIQQHAVQPVPTRPDLAGRPDMRYASYATALTEHNRSATTSWPPHPGQTAPSFASYYHPSMTPQQQAPTTQMTSSASTPYPYHQMAYAPQYAAQPQRGYDVYRNPPPQQHQGTPTDPSAAYARMAYQAMNPPVAYGDYGDCKRPLEESTPSMTEGSDDDHARALKRPRLVWTPPLHKRFVDAVSHLGIKNAVPKTIMQLMNVEGLTRENVASHLQKYRLYLKRLQGCSESTTMENSPSQEDGDGAQPPSSPGKGNSGGSDAGHSEKVASARPSSEGAAAGNTSSDEETAAALKDMEKFAGNTGKPDGGKGDEGSQ